MIDLCRAVHRIRKLATGVQISLADGWALRRLRRGIALYRDDQCVATMPSDNTAKALHTLSHHLPKDAAR